jgi:uncharacterized membrane protein YphA (DoxX/SURF4 family)
VQKLFTAFPSGSPGSGLLLLRSFVALTLIAQGLTYVRASDPNLSKWLIVLLFFAGAGCLLIGVFTPIAAIVIAFGAIAFAIFIDSNYAVVVVIILAAAIALLGPGAYSVDARLFGRREIRIP